MKRRNIRRFGAQWAMLALLFGQLSLVAYACPVQTPAAYRPVAHTAAQADAHGAACTGMTAAPDSPLTNACKVHCSDGATPPSSPDLQPYALAAFPLPPLALAQPAPVGKAAWNAVTALQGAPPLALRYCRLLI